ncbi:MAG: hypothetical protein ACP5QK_11130 [Myxococcota bacterium]
MQRIRLPLISARLSGGEDLMVASKCLEALKRMEGGARFGDRGNLFVWRKQQRLRR